MGSDDGIMGIDLSAALPQIPDQFFTGLELPACRLIPVEVADQANAKSDVVQVIAVDVTAIDLAAPAITDFDFTISGRGSIPDNKMIGKTVLHAADMAVVIIKNPRAPLPRPAVVHDNELPAAPHDWRAINLSADCARKVTITDFAPRPWPPTAAGRRSRRRFVALIAEKSRFLDVNLRNPARVGWRTSARLRGCSGCSRRAR